MRRGPKFVLVDARCARCGGPTEQCVVRDWEPVQPDPEKVCGTCSFDLICERKLAAMTPEDEAAELAELRWYESEHVANGSRSYAHEKTMRARVARDWEAFEERRARYRGSEEQRGPFESKSPPGDGGLRAELGDAADEAADGFRCAGCRQRVCFQEAGLEEASRLCRDCGDELSGAGAADAARPEWKPGTEIPRRLLAIPDENPPGMPCPLLEGGQPLPWAEYPLGQREGDHLIAYDDDSCAYLEPVQLQVPERLYEAFYGRLCVLCGQPLGDPVLFFADLDDWVVAQGGLHRRCARFTRAHCPGVPSRDLLSVPAALWEELVRTGDHPDKYSAIRPEREWLERAYERAVDDPDSVLLGDPEPLPGDSD